MPRTRPIAPPRTDLLETPLFPALVRPPLIAGVERELAIPLVGVVLMLLVGFRPNWVTPAAASLVVVVVLPALRRATKRDPQLFEVIKGHLRLGGFYPARGAHDQRRRRVPTFGKSR